MMNHQRRSAGRTSKRVISIMVDYNFPSVSTVTPEPESCIHQILPLLKNYQI